MIKLLLIELSSSRWIKTCLNHTADLTTSSWSLRNWLNAKQITAKCTSANELSCIQASERVLCTYTNALLQSSSIFGWRSSMLSVIYHYWINLSIWAFFGTINWAVFINYCQIVNVWTICYVFPREHVKSQKWDNFGKFSQRWEVMSQSGSLHAKIPLIIGTQWLEGFFSQIVTKKWVVSLHLIQRFDPFFVDPVSSFGHPFEAASKEACLEWLFVFP